MTSDRCRDLMLTVVLLVLTGCGGGERRTFESSGPGSDGAAAPDNFETSGPLESIELTDIVPRNGGFTKERVYFVTNREPDESAENPGDYFLSELGSLQFGACDVSIPYNRPPGTMPEPSLLKLEFREDPQKHIVLLKIDLLDRDSLKAAVSQRIGKSREKEAMVFIHGYNNTFRDAARRTAQLAYDLNFEGAAIFFSWPAGRTNYLADSRRAQASIDDCVELLALISRECGAKRIHVIAHSMGNFVLANALKNMADNPAHSQGLQTLHHIALAAPDIDAKVFRDRIAPKIRSLATRYTVYASHTDLAMEASREANGWAPLGDVNDESVKAGELPYVDFIDATEISKESWFSIGHAYYGDMPELITDIRALFRDEPPSNRRLTPSGSIYLLKP